MKNRSIFLLFLLMPAFLLHGQPDYNGIGSDMHNLYRLSDAKTRSISPENRTGEKGKGGLTTIEEGSAAHAARDLGQGWKVNPYLVVKPDENLLDLAQTRFKMYRWHITDPIRFEEDLKVTMQALGWRSGGRYLPLKDDISSVAYWYQTEPHAPFPELPDKDALELR